MSRQTRPRSPGLIFAALGLVLIALLGVFALTSRTPPPPTIAEFAPQAVENITDAPNDQSSSSGRNGGAGPGASTPTPATAQTEQPGIQVPRVRKCVGDPPRQIEDPQSPPCVPYFAGDNGGSTSKGVTRDSVTIGVTDVTPYDVAFVNFFNKRFEFYGRSMKIADLGGAADPYNPDAQRAQAVDADEKYRVFAVGQRYRGFDYADELARRGIISVARQPLYTEGAMAARRPYMWSYPMATDQLFAGIGSWACARLAGNLASHAGFRDAEPMSRERRLFGIVMENVAPANPFTTAPMEQRLNACNATPAARVQVQPSDYSNGVAASSAVIRLKDAKVTSVICACSHQWLGVLEYAASSQTYGPEWLVSSYDQNDIEYVLKAFNPADQLGRTFGITVVPRQVRPDQHPAIWAGTEADPSLQTPQDGPNVAEWDIHYRAFLLLASGIQLAGPGLTPASFERGLQKAVFPNPASPLRAGAVGFSGNSHAMTRDAAEWWWSTTARSVYAEQGGGAMCYVDGGARHTVHDWPPGDPFFKGACD